MRGLFGKYELSNMVQCVLVKNHFANRHWLTSLYVCSVNICRPNGFWSKDMDNWNFCQKLKFSLEMSEKPRRLNQNELLQLFRYVIAEFQFFAKISIVNIFWLKPFVRQIFVQPDKQFTNNHNETYCQENYNINSRHAKGSLNIFPS